MTDIQKAELTIALNCARDILVRCEGNLGTKPTKQGHTVKTYVQDALESISTAVSYIRSCKE
jgi:hypothetical protein